MTFVGVTVLGIAGLFGIGCIDHRPTAEAEARTWAKQMFGNDTVNISCASRDTDNDGYVSCTVSTRNTKGDVTLHPIECAAMFTWNDGCRAPKMRIPSSGQ